MGKPHTLTPERHSHFLVCLISCRGIIKPAAAKAGIAYRTLRDWVERGEDGEEPFATLVTDMHRIRGDKAADMLGHLERISRDTLGPQSVAASQLILSYLMPDTFGDKALKASGIAEGVQAVMDAVQPLMSEGAYGELLRAMATLAGHGRMDQGEAAGAPAYVDAQGERVNEPGAVQHPVLPAGAERKAE